MIVGSNPTPVEVFGLRLLTFTWLYTYLRAWTPIPSGLLFSFHHQVCDHHQDCHDNSDEEGCPSHCGTCSSVMFKCHRTCKCLTRMFVCDDHDDCGDGSDEMGCHHATTTTTQHPTTHAGSWLVSLVFGFFNFRPPSPNSAPFIFGRLV